MLRIRLFPRSALAGSAAPQFWWRLFQWISPATSILRRRSKAHKFTRVQWGGAIFARDPLVGLQLCAACLGSFKGEGPRWRALVSGRRRVFGLDAEVLQECQIALLRLSRRRRRRRRQALLYQGTLSAAYAHDTMMTPIY